jgi:hypothetical protein
MPYLKRSIPFYLRRIENICKIMDYFDIIEEQYYPKPTFLQMEKYIKNLPN